MMAQEVDRKTIAILLAMIVPGAGHIYYSPSKRGRGFGISILFIIVTFLSYRFIGQFIGFGVFGNIIEFVPIFIVWALQMRAAMRFN